MVYAHESFGIIRAEVISMQDKPRIEVLTTPSNYDGVRLQVENVIVQNRDSFNFKMTELPHMEVAIENLKKGHADLLAMSINQWKSIDTEDLQICAFLARREPTWVLVSDDKPEYLPFGGKIICEKKLIKRQMLRMRDDLAVMTTQEFFHAELTEDYPKDFIDVEQELELLETFRKNGQIDGYIISRGKFKQINARVRRHTLGMQREKPTQEFERSKFISPPLEGFTILVSRTGFPSQVIDALNDKAAETCYAVENSIYESLSDELKQISGIYVEQKKLSTILKQYLKLIDDSYALKIGENYLIPSTKKTRDSRTLWKPSKDLIQGPRICIYFELLGIDSKVSLELVRIEPLEDNKFDRGKNILIKEIKFIVDLLCKEHDELKRLISGLPEEYAQPKQGLLQL